MTDNPVEATSRHGLQLWAGIIVLALGMVGAFVAHGAYKDADFENQLRGTLVGGTSADLAGAGFYLVWTFVALAVALTGAVLITIAVLASNRR